MRYGIGNTIKVICSRIILLLNVFALTGCGQENNSNAEAHYEAETTMEDDMKQQDIAVQWCEIEREEQRIRKGFWKLASGDYSYTEHELVTEGRRSNSQVSVRRIADGYEVKLYDQVYNEVFSMIYPKEPWIVEVTENVLEIGLSTGSPARNVFYFDKNSGRSSIGYMNSRLIDEKYVAYMENEELIFTDLFNEEIYLEIKRDFAPAVDPVISIEMLDDETILLQYYRGEAFLEEQEAIRIGGTG